MKKIQLKLVSYLFAANFCIFLGAIPAYAQESYVDEDDGESIPLNREDIVPDVGLEGRNGNDLSFFSIDIGSAFSLGVGPVIFMSSDRGRQIVNLCQDSALELGARPGPYLLQTGPCTEGYKVIQSRTQERGLGLEVSISPVSGALSFFGISAGIVPVRGSMTVSERHVDTFKDAKTLRAMKVPFKANDIQNWQVGDRITYSTYGGLITYAVADIGPLFNLGVQYLAQGSWKVMVSKSDENQVLVQLTKSKLNGLSMYAGAFFANVSLSKFRNLDDRFSFSLDLADPEAAQAYESLLRGNLRPVQEAATKKISPAIVMISKEHSSAYYRNRKFQVSVPMIFRMSRNQSRIVRDSETFFYQNNEKLEANYAVFMKNYFRSVTPFFSGSTFYKHHKSTVKSFAGVRYKITRADGTTALGHKAELEWSYMNDDAETDDFNGALQSLYAYSGLREDLLVKLPQGFWKLGYTGVFFNVTFSQQALDELMDLGEDLGKNSFSTPNLRAAKWHLKMMKKHLNNEKKFASSLANFGQALMSSRATMRVVAQAVPELLQARYRLEGEKFHNVERVFALK